MKKMKKLLEEIKPDILDAHYLTSYGIPASRLRFHPFIINIWGSDILLDHNRYGEKHADLMRKALREVDIIVCDGENTKEEIIKLGKEPGRVQLILLGVDTKKFYPQPKDTEITSSLGILDSQIVISLRNLEPVYDIETLIKAIPSVLSQTPDTKFIIAGEGSQRGYLEGLAKSLGIWESIRFVGMIPHDELPQYLTLADVYVSTSLSDGGVSVSTLEAMACGLPVVTTDVGDNKKWIKDGDNGFLIPTKNPSRLAERVIYLLKNLDIRGEIGVANRKAVEENFSYENEMSKMEELYKELVRRYQE